MNQDFKQVAQQAIQQCQAYEARIAQLQTELTMRKQAKLADNSLIQKSVDALVKSGSIRQDQADQTKSLLENDPNASLRAISALCGRIPDAQLLVKKQSMNIQGGTLISNKKSKQSSTFDSTQAYQGVAKALGLNLK